MGLSAEDAIISLSCCRRPSKPNPISFWTESWTEDKTSDKSLEKISSRKLMGSQKINRLSTIKHILHYFTVIASSNSWLFMVITVCLLQGQLANYSQPHQVNLRVPKSTPWQASSLEGLLLGTVLNLPFY